MDMKNIDAALAEIMDLPGAIATSLIDWQSGMVFGMKSRDGFNIELASASNAEVIKAKMKTMKTLGYDGSIKEIMLVLSSQEHFIHILQSNPELCIYVALDSSDCNMALTRLTIKNLDK